MKGYTYMTIDEVNCTEVREHSNYVLQMACASVSRNVEEAEGMAESDRAEVLSQVEPLEGYPPVDGFTWEE